MVVVSVDLFEMICVDMSQSIGARVSDRKLMSESCTFSPQLKHSLPSFNG